MYFLELRTIAFLAFVEALILGVIFIFYSHAKKRYPGTFELGFCLIMVAMGLFLLSIQKIAGDFVSFVLANTVVIAGLCLTPYGFRKFFFMSGRAPYYIFLTAAGFVANFIAVMVLDSFFVRQFVTFGIQAAIFWESFYILFYKSDAAVKTIARAASVIYFLLGTLFGFKFLMMIFAPEANSATLMVVYTPTQQLVSALTLVGALVAIVSAYTFFIMMVTFRLEAEVKAGEVQTGRYINKLEEANAARSKFYSIISHDLRGPVGGMHELLTSVSRRENLPADVVEYIKVLKETSESTNELLNNLLQWTKAELGTMEVNPEPVRVTDMVAKTIKLLDIKIKNKNLAVINETAPELSVHVDPTMFSTIIRNLAANAVKFTAGNGTIKFSGTLVWENGRRMASISVADTGIGIDPESLEKLFTINNQSAIKFGTAGESGSGLGLLICREFAELSGGSIAAASEPGKGSVFTLNLPAAEI